MSPLSLCNSKLFFKLSDVMVHRCLMALIALLSFFMTMTLQATPGKYFVGAHLGFNFTSGGSSGSNNTKITGDIKAFGLGARFGRLTKGFRWYASYELAPYKEIYLHSGLAQADFVLPLRKRLYGYLGGHAGWGFGRWRGKGSAAFNLNTDSNAHGYIVGGQFGAYYRITPKWDVDIGGRVSYMGIETTGDNVNRQCLDFRYGFFGGVQYRF